MIFCDLSEFEQIGSLLEGTLKGGTGGGGSFDGGGTGIEMNITEPN